MKHRAAIALFAVIGLSSIGSTDDKLVVHEWGTFTSFQSESGDGLHGINTDDEPVPRFVHQLGRSFLVSPTEIAVEELHLSQGARSADPRMTMRLETPVLYFHLPPSQKSATLDVSVDFRGGLLTQFFPFAVATANGKPVNNYRFPEGTLLRGSLRWADVRVGEAGAMPDTSELCGWLRVR